MSAKYKCIFCDNHYTRKSYYERHTLVCEMNNTYKNRRNTIDDESQDTPNIRKLYNIIMELTIKCNKMEKKIEDFSKIIVSKKKKINVIEWLTINHNGCKPFHEYINSIHIERKHLQTVFEHGLTHAFVYIFKELFTDTTNTANIPICSFKHKPNLLFICDYKNNIYSDIESTDLNNENNNENQLVWSEISVLSFYKIMNKINNLLYKEFVLWQNENIQNFDDTDFDLKYSDYVIKINGGKNKSEKDVFYDTYKQLYKHFITDISLTI